MHDFSKYRVNFNCPLKSISQVQLLIDDVFSVFSLVDSLKRERWTINPKNVDFAKKKMKTFYFSLSLDPLDVEKEEHKYIKFDGS